ncbi:hypothetical protein PCE1_004776 [Barthelona sp. PCE]
MISPSDFDSSHSESEKNEQEERLLETPRERTFLDSPRVMNDLESDEEEKLFNTTEIGAPYPWEQPLKPFKSRITDPNSQYYNQVPSETARRAFKKVVYGVRPSKNIVSILQAFGCVPPSTRESKTSKCYHCNFTNSLQKKLSSNHLSILSPALTNQREIVGMKHFSFCIELKKCKDIPHPAENSLCIHRYVRLTLWDTVNDEPLSNIFEIPANRDPTCDNWLFDNQSHNNPIYVFCNLNGCRRGGTIVLVCEVGFTLQFLNQKRVVTQDDQGNVQYDLESEDIDAFNAGKTVTYTVGHYNIPLVDLSSIAENAVAPIVEETLIYNNISGSHSEHLLGGDITEKDTVEVLEKLDNAMMPHKKRRWMGLRAPTAPNPRLVYKITRVPTRHAERYKMLPSNFISNPGVCLMSAMHQISCAKCHPTYSRLSNRRIFDPIALLPRLIDVPDIRTRLSKVFETEYLTLRRRANDNSAVIELVRELCAKFNVFLNATTVPEYDVRKPERLARAKTFNDCANFLPNLHTQKMSTNNPKPFSITEMIFE